ncbi:MAG: hypothetical protein GPJ05_14205 [Microcystis aeruginosa G13-10]|nr:hypothetical protein [Microcystis aeruginosa G13-10]
MTTLGTQKAAVLSILDDDVQLNFNAANYTVREDGTAVTDIIITRTGRTTGTVGATLNFANGTATGCPCPPASVTYDFYNGAFAFTLGDNEMSKVIQVEDAKLAGSNAIRIRNDSKVEGDEYFTINLNNPTGGATIGNQNSATVTILDDDVQLAFSSPTFTIREDGTAIAAVTEMLPILMTTPKLLLISPLLREKIAKLLIFLSEMILSPNQMKPSI